MRCLVVAVLVLSVIELTTGIKSTYVQQLKGIKKLLKGSTMGVFPTCKMVLFAQLVDYDTADEHCKAFDMGTGRTEPGNLATVDHSNKNEDLKMLLNFAYPGEYGKWSSPEWVWAGLRKTKNNVGRLTAAQKAYKTEDWEWANGTNPLEFHKWMNKQPDQRQLNYGKNGCEDPDGCYQNQMRINHKGRWDDTFKFKTHPYVCDYHGKYLLSGVHMTWRSAKAACEEAGLVLAEVRNTAEVKEMVALSEYFLGPYDNTTRIYNNTNWIWLGGNDLDEEGTWTWLDREEARWDGMPWRIPQPDNAEYAMDNGQDVMAISRWGQFDDSFELKRKRPFACMCPHA